MIRMGYELAPGLTVFIHEFVTGGGFAGKALPLSLAAEGSAMRRALAEDFAGLNGVRVVMTLDSCLPDEPGLATIVRVGPGEEPATFARLAREADYTLCVAPETGGVLRDRARTILDVGGRSLGSSPESIACSVVGDDLPAWRFAERAVAGVESATPQGHAARRL